MQSDGGLVMRMRAVHAVSQMARAKTRKVALLVRGGLKSRCASAALTFISEVLSFLGAQ